MHSAWAHEAMRAHSVYGSTTNEIADLERRLAKLDRESLSIVAALEQLKKRAAAQVQPTMSSQIAGAIGGGLQPAPDEVKLILAHVLECQLVRRLAEVLAEVRM
jgi:hypothetical protein